MSWLSLFDFLPTDIWIKIASYLDGRSLGRCSLLDQKFHSFFGSPDQLKEMLRLILQPMTRLDLSGFTLKELTLLCQTDIENLRRRNRALSTNGHSLVLDSQGFVCSFGSNEQGQLGTIAYEDITPPTWIGNFADITAIAAGASHSLFLDSGSHIFSCGDYRYGQLGLLNLCYGCGPFPIKKVDLGSGPIDIPISMAMVAISASSIHSLILNSEGQVFSFGSGDFGMSGLGNQNIIYVPTLITKFVGVTINPIIVAISAGNCHSLLLDSQGQIYGFGLNGYGQLGIKGGGQYLYPSLIIQKGPRFIAISAGGFHSLALDRQGQVYSFGFGKRGQLGHMDEENQFTPTMIEGFNQPIIAISAGFSHSLVLDSRGRVFAFGENACGQLGISFLHNSYGPILLKSMTNIIAISAGKHCSLVLDYQGRVYSFGRGEFGQLGLNDTEDRFTPTLIPNLLVV
jgi:alpha-tubulin suppressor-like RCC1 family protein